MPVDKKITLLYLAINLSNGKLVISPDAILIYFKLNFFIKKKLFSPNGLHKNFIFFFF